MIKAVAFTLDPKDKSELDAFIEMAKVEAEAQGKGFQIYPYQNELYIQELDRTFVPERGLSYVKQTRAGGKKHPEPALYVTEHRFGRKLN